jgi:hypothetical protein
MRCDSDIGDVASRSVRRAQAQVVLRFHGRGNSTIGGSRSLKAISVDSGDRSNPMTAGAAPSTRC